MRFLLVIAMLLLPGCASTTTILEADANCYPYTSTKDEYRDCLADKYDAFNEKVSTYETTVFKFLVGILL